VQFNCGGDTAEDALRGFAAACESVQRQLVKEGLLVDSGPLPLTLPMLSSPAGSGSSTRWACGAAPELELYELTTAAFFHKVGSLKLVQYLQRRGLKAFHLGHKRVLQSLQAGLLLEGMEAGQPKALAFWQCMSRAGCQGRGGQPASAAQVAGYRPQETRATKQQWEQHKQKTVRERLRHTPHAVGMDVVQKVVAPQLLQPGSPIPPECRERSWVRSPISNFTQFRLELTSSAACALS
jgi:hypothetical protein